MNNDHQYGYCRTYVVLLLVIIGLGERVRYDEMYEGLIDWVNRIWYFSPFYVREIKIEY